MNYQLDDEDNWVNGIDNPKYRAWSGYEFELVGLTHIKDIKVVIGIEINKAYDEILQTKIQVFRESTGTNKALLLTFVTPMV